MSFDFDKEFPAVAWALKEAPTARRARWRRMIAARNLLVIVAVALWAGRGALWVGLRIADSRRAIGTVTESLNAHGVHCDRIYGGWFTSDQFNCAVLDPIEYPGGDMDPVIHDKAFDDGLLGQCATVQLMDAKAKYEMRKWHR